MKKTLFCTSIISTYVWGIIAHAYCFLHDTYSHDSMSTIYATAGEDLWKIKLGRYIAPLVRQMTVGRLCLPWLAGIISLFLIALAVYGICCILSISSPAVTVLTAGIMVTNITITATAATFLYELSIDMTALVFAVITVYIWYFKDKWAFFSAVFVFLTLGLYQSYISVTITLMIMVSIQDILLHKELKCIICKGLKGIGVIIIGSILYFAVLLLIIKIGNIDIRTNTYNGVYNIKMITASSIVKRIPGLYYSWLHSYLKNQSVFPWQFIATVNIMIFAISLYIIGGILHQADDFRAKILGVVLCALLPLGMNASYLFSGIWSHELMRYAFCLPIVFCLSLTSIRKTCFKITDERLIKHCAFILVLVILIANVRTANTAYLKKEFEKRATISVMNRVQSALEQRADYIYGDTKVVFVGAPRFEMRGFDSLKNVTGLSINSVFSNDTLVQSEYHPYRAYYEYYMGDLDVLADDETWIRICKDEAVKNMTNFPNAGSMKLINNVMVVKLGDI